MHMALVLGDGSDPAEATDDELTGFHLELLKLLEDDFEEPVERKPAKTVPQKFAVPTGVCPRCQGYLVNDPERGDGIWDTGVYRCFNCGHRVSPVYEWNRR